MDTESYARSVADHRITSTSSHGTTINLLLNVKRQRHGTPVSIHQNRKKAKVKNLIAFITTMGAAYALDFRQMIWTSQSSNARNVGIVNLDTDLSERLIWW